MHRQGQLSQALDAPGFQSCPRARLKLDNVLCPSGPGQEGSPAAIVVDWELGVAGPQVGTWVA